MRQSRLEFLQELLDSPVDVLERTWPGLLLVLIITGVPTWLATKKFSERENLKWKVYLLLLPAICIVFFCVFFLGYKAYHDFSFEAVFGWLGLTILVWAVLFPLFAFNCFSPRSSFDSRNYSNEIENNIDDLFDMAMKIGKEKREGKNTSKQEAEYNRKVESLEKNGYLDEHQGF